MHTLYVDINPVASVSVSLQTTKANFFDQNTKTFCITEKYSSKSCIYIVQSVKKHVTNTYHNVCENTHNTPGKLIILAGSRGRKEKKITNK